MSLLQRYYNLNRIQLFIGIVLSYLLLIWLSKAVLINEIVFYNTYSEQLSYDRSLKLFETLTRLSWINYVFTPILLLVKFSLISFVLYIGIVFFNKQEEVSLGSVFKIVIASEIIFVIAALVKFLWFFLFAGNYDLNDIGFFYPLSLINIFKSAEVSRLWIYPLQTANLFHLTYLFLISYGLINVCNIEKGYSDKIVLLSYVPSVILWVALLMFLTIDASL
jgi:hypothetical protein